MALAVRLDHPELHRSSDGFYGGAVASQQIRTGRFAADNSYPTLGEPFAAADIALDTINFIFFAGMAGYRFEYDYTNSKVKFLFADAANVADTALIEVPNTTDLSATLTAVRFFALGVVAAP